jgi:hypothetical protein
MFCKGLPTPIKLTEGACSHSGWTWCKLCMFMDNSNSIAVLTKKGLPPKPCNRLCFRRPMLDDLPYFELFWIMGIECTLAFSNESQYPFKSGYSENIRPSNTFLSASRIDKVSEDQKPQAWEAPSDDSREYSCIRVFLPAGRKIVVSSMALRLCSLAGGDCDT